HGWASSAAAARAMAFRWIFAWRASSFGEQPFLIGADRPHGYEARDAIEKSLVAALVHPFVEFGFTAAGGTPAVFWGYGKRFEFDNWFGHSQSLSMALPWRAIAGPREPSWLLVRG